jgi:hypothetical protein
MLFLGRFHALAGRLWRYYQKTHYRTGNHTGTSVLVVLSASRQLAHLNLPVSVAGTTVPGASAPAKLAPVPGG